MAWPSIISLELPTQGFSFQDVESSIIMFPFRSKGRKRQKGRGVVRQKEWQSVGSQTLMVSEWGFVHMVHLALSSIICPHPHNTKNNKRWNIDFSSPSTSVSLFISVLAPLSSTPTHVAIVNKSGKKNNSNNANLLFKKNRTFPVIDKGNPLSS